MAVLLKLLTVLVYDAFFNIYYPVPFDEDDKDKSVWFLDHDYLENMYGMFKKVNGEYYFLILFHGR